MTANLRRRIARACGEGGVLRNVFTVAGSTAASQLLSLAALPLLGRRFDAEAFGLFGLFFTLTTTVATLPTLGLQEAILVPASAREARRVLGVVLLSASGMSVVIGALCAVLISRDAFGLGALPIWSAAALTPSVWLIALAMIFQIWLIRTRDFKTLSRATLGLGAARASAQLCAAVAASLLGWVGLLCGELAGRGASVFLMTRRRPKEIAYSLGLAAQSGFAPFRQYRSFVLFRTPSHFANNLASALPLFLLSRSFDPAQIGAYSFMIGVVVGPIGLAIRGVGDVFLGEFSARYRKDRAAARRFLMMTVGALGVGAALTAAIVALSAPDLFALLFGERWRLSGTLAVSYLPLLAAQLVIAPVGGVLFVCNRPGAKLAVDVASIAFQLIAALAAQWLGLSFVASASAICAAASCAYVLYGALIFLAIREREG